MMMCMCVRALVHTHAYGSLEEWERNVVYQYVPSHTEITCKKLQSGQANPEQMKYKSAKC
jgi:hypothetical protein